MTELAQKIVTVEQVNGEWCVVLFRAQAMPVVLPYQDQQTAELVARGFKLNFFEVFAPAIDAAVAAERARCVAIAEGFTRAPMDYREWLPGLAADDRARLIAAALAGGRVG